jgi:hypothetical protein
VRTLREIQSTLTTIGAIPEFKSLLGRRTGKEQKELKQISAKLNNHSRITKRIRDCLGGHVLPGSVEKALNNLGPDSFGFFEVVRLARKTHFRMAEQLVVEILADGEPESQKAAKIESDVLVWAKLLPVVESLEKVVEIYLSARGYL